ncbi:hypothetical protein [Streptomyces sp. NPDC056169]|uniref:hypothetical protein n=1 Tax=Streptomyces sp. NPDC056169 TaxID=3345734 RepID=UPI0035DB0E2A
MPYHPTATPSPDRRPADHPSAASDAVAQAHSATRPDSAEQNTAESNTAESITAERHTAVAWPRVARLGAARPGPAARRARWFGVPLVPLVLAGLVVGGFMAVGGGEDLEGPAAGRPGGGPPAAPSPVVTTEDAADAARTPAPRVDTSSTGTPPTVAPSQGGPVAGTPTHAAPDAGPGPQGKSGSPQPSRTPSTAPAATATRPTPSTTSTGTGPSGRPVSFEALRVGECFDIDRATPGTALRRDCDTPHDAELVARPRLTGTYADDQQVREAATELCRAPLRAKAALQPLGSRWTTFVQYPYRTSYLLGSDTVACSLAARSATGGKLTGLLH